MPTRRALLAAAPLLWAAIYGRTMADTPRDTLVMAKRIDDIISLDPQESFEYSGTEICGNVYEKLVNPGDDDLEPDIVRFGGWNLVHLTHRHPRTGERAPGPSEAAVTEVLVSRAAAGAGPEEPEQPADRGPAGSQPAPEGMDPEWFYGLSVEDQVWVARQYENLIYFANMPEF